VLVLQLNLVKAATAVMIAAIHAAQPAVIHAARPTHAQHQAAAQPAAANHVVPSSFCELRRTCAMPDPSSPRLRRDSTMLHRSSLGEDSGTVTLNLP